MLVEENWWRPFAGGDVVETLWRQGGGGGGVGVEVDLVGHKVICSQLGSVSFAGRN